MRPLRWIVHTRRHPSAVLLVVQLGGMLLYPFIEHADNGRIAFGVFGILVLGVTTRMVRRTPGLVWVSLGFALPAVLLLALQALYDLPQLLPWSSALEAAFYFYAAGSLIAYMSSDQNATTDELFAAAATFTLLAWAFAYVFLFLQAVQPGSITASTDPQGTRTWTELVFMSFALLSSTGIGDVVPVRPVARAVASVEMFVGVMYLTFVVSRLVGLTLPPRR